MIVVAGHSVIVGGNLQEAETNEDVWYMLDYQKGKGLPQSIIAHIRAGILEASNDPNSLLIFSGGETRGGIGPVNEGSSYFRVSDALDLWDSHHDDLASPVNGHDTNPVWNNVRARTVTEEFATDSFQNL